MRKAMQFSEDFQRKVAAAYQNGLSLSQIKRKHHIGPSQVRRILPIFGVKMRLPGPAKPTANDSLQQQIITAYTEGLPIHQVAKFLSVSRELVRVVLIQHEVPLRCSRRSVDPTRGERKKPGYWDTVDVAGREFGKLTAIKKVGSRKGHPIWECRCDCGKITRVPVSKLVYRGPRQSCGCSRGFFATENRRKPGRQRNGKVSTEYRIWGSIWQRCGNPKNPAYDLYGGRGITVCPEWSSFDVFLQDMGERPSSKHSLDRIDNDGPYSPSNCRWTTYRQQANNRRGNQRLTFRGETLTLAEWARRTEIPVATIWYRFKAGWDVERILTIHPIIGCSHPFKYRARSAVFLEVRMKRMPRAKDCRCQNCGMMAWGYHHHLGYDREHWLDVIPLCRRCHDIADHSEQIA